MSTRSYGQFGEEIARNFLLSKGYRILTSNFSSRFGEIDIIAQKDGTVYFAEVKTRWSRVYGTPVEAVTLRKLSRIRKTAEYFIQIKNLKDVPVAIIVVSVELENGILKEVKLLTVDE